MVIKVLNKNKKKVIIKRYKELVNFYFNNAKKELDFDDKAFTNLLDVLHPVVKGHNFYSSDIYVSSIVWHLEVLEKIPIFIDERNIEALIEDIYKDFEINKGMHYLIFPLQGSVLKEDIIFSNIQIITKKDEKEMIQQISEITSIDSVDVRDLLEHTKKSRSNDFMKSNLMIIKIENQTENIRMSANQLGQDSVVFLNMIHSAYGHTSNILTTHRDIGKKENKHVAILSKEGWRCGHSYNWAAHLECKLDLDFMAKKECQDVFDKLLKSFTFYKDDSLSEKFVNAFSLYSRAIIQRRKHKDDTMALLLFIIALESIFTESRNEKRIRLAVIIPKLVEIEDITAYELGLLISNLYIRRNSFVHIGKIQNDSYRDNKIDILERVVSLVLLKYLELENLIDFKENENRCICYFNSGPFSVEISAENGATILILPQKL